MFLNFLVLIALRFFNFFVYTRNTFVENSLIGIHKRPYELLMIILKGIVSYKENVLVVYLGS
jgi:hypothetical protein